MPQDAAERGQSHVYRRGWQYATNGDYHRNLDPNWSYTPTYLRKMYHVRGLISSLGSHRRILDAGCGEGVLVEEFAARGFQIKGMDANYSSPSVIHGNVCAMPFEDGMFDAVLLLDVFEHLAFSDQPTALREIRRVLTSGGTLIATIPNLAHLNSRLSLLFSGRLDRSDNELDHPGERPLYENIEVIHRNGFRIKRITGITLTIPWLYRRVICRHAGHFRWLHDAFERLARPSLSLLNLFVCERND